MGLNEAVFLTEQYITEQYIQYIYKERGSSEIYITWQTILDNDALEPALSSINVNVIYNYISGMRWCSSSATS